MRRQHHKITIYVQFKEYAQVGGAHEDKTLLLNCTYIIVKNKPSAKSLSYYCTESCAELKKADYHCIIIIIIILKSTISMHLNVC